MQYIGSKLSLLSFINETIEELPLDTHKHITFCDLFTGTGVVSKYFKKKGYSIISNDLQYYSYVTANHFIANNSILSFPNLKDLDIEPFSYLNAISGIEGFIYNNYSNSGTINKEYNRLYFSDSNATKIDSIRLQIEQWKQSGIINNQEYFFLLASLIEATDKVANTTSVYEAFLKKLKSTAEKDLILKPLETIVFDGENKYKVFNKDANVLIKEIEGDILYLDPPYNHRRYNTNYHILETVALYDNPQIKGKTGIRVEDKNSKYCSKKEALFAFEDLIRNANFKFILLSYNDEGIISSEDIKKTMLKYGKYSRKEKEYKRFKADNNRTYKKNLVLEYIHCLEKV